MSRIIPVSFIFVLSILLFYVVRADISLTQPEHKVIALRKWEGIHQKEMDIPNLRIGLDKWDISICIKAPLILCKTKVTEQVTGRLWVKTLVFSLKM